ncbi:MAG: response regulator [Desulfobulbaceae bacterium]|nr:response regulator [Desulfobulbaceae bacterium]HIJ78746.1 response regulator [Deltaproteobacteria bacterium]
MKKKKILFADDEPAIRARLKLILANNYLVEQAENGQEAVEKLKKFKADIVLLDIDMPIMTGLEACKKIRESPSLKSTKIIMVSGEISLEDRLLGYKVGADDYLTKPFDENELLAKIQIMLRLKYTEEIDKILMDFVKLFSHESRTPLNGIMGFAKIISSQTDDEKTRQQAEMILHSANHLINFSDKVTMLCRIKKGQSLDLITDSTANLFKKIMSFVEKFDRVDCRLADYGEQFVAYDWPALEKAIEIITNNALRYTPADQKVVIKTATDDHFVVIDIMDYGPGIAPQLIDHLFEPFTMPDDDIYSQPCAHISLACANQIVELHEGEISATNRQDGGAVFSIRLPTASPTHKD